MKTITKVDLDLLQQQRMAIIHALQEDDLSPALITALDGITNFLDDVWDKLHDSGFVSIQVEQDGS